MVVKAALVSAENIDANIVILYKNYYQKHGYEFVILYVKQEVTR